MNPRKTTQSTYVQQSAAKAVSADCPRVDYPKSILKTLIFLPRLLQKVGIRQTAFFHLSKATFKKYFPLTRKIKAFCRILIHKLCQHNVVFLYFSNYVPLRILSS